MGVESMIHAPNQSPLAPFYPSSGFSKIILRFFEDHSQEYPDCFEPIVPLTFSSVTKAASRISTDKREEELLMDKWTFGFTMLAVGMGGTIATLIVFSLIMGFLKKLFPYRKEEDVEA